MKRQFKKNILKVVSGNVFGKGIGLLAMPLLTRLYSPEDFAELSILISMVLIFGPFMHLGYAYSIPLSGNEKFRIVLASFCLALSFFISMLFVFILSFVLLTYNVQVAHTILWMAIFGSLMSSHSEVLKLYYARVGEFNRISFAVAQQSIVNAGLKIILSISSVKGLVVGQGCQDLVPNFYFYRDFLNRFKKSKVFINKRKFLKIAGVYSSFPKFRLISHLMLVASSQAPIFGFMYLFEKSDLGYYTLAIMTINLPVSLIANATAQVFYGEIASIRKKNTKELLSVALQVVGKLALIGTVPTIILVLFGPELFSLIFGKNWTASGEYSTLLAYIIIPQMVAVNLIKIASLFNKQAFLMSINFSRLVITLCVFIAAYMFSLEPTVTVGVYCLVIVIHYVYTSLLSLAILSEGKIDQEAR